MTNTFLDIPKDSPFPIQNLPYGIFSTGSSSKRPGVAIGEYVLDLQELEKQSLIESKYFSEQSTLNFFIAQGKQCWSKTRQELQSLLTAGSSFETNQTARDAALLPMSAVEMHMPVSIGDYTDFYSSKEHATNVGTMFRDPDNALLPNWLHIPVAYHGRASSVVVSGTKIRRPCGQTKPDGQDLPSFGPSKLLDFELEMGCIIGKSNSLGEAISIEHASEHVFGFVLVNDWSARDIQKWEYVPLGPFLAKNLATSISPWIVTLDALTPFKVSGPRQEPEPLPYLKSNDPWSFDIDLEVFLNAEGLGTPHKIAHSNFKYMYWNICQQIAHHTVSGCNLQVGDLLASGTISGPTEDSFGSLLELTWKGTKPIQLPNGESRKFLLDNDEVIMKAFAKNNDYQIGFGEVSGMVTAAQVDESLVVSR